MAVAVSEVAYRSSQRGSDSDNEFELDIYGHDSKFRTFEAWRETPQIEKQISIDPISLKGSPSVGEVSFNLMLSPIHAPKNIDMPLPQHPLPSKLKFLSNSVPSSATSSPRLSSFISKKGKNETQGQLDVAASMLQESILLRSKSCGDGRAFAPFDPLDLLMTKKYATETIKKQHSNFTNVADLDPNKNSYRADEESDGMNRDYPDSFKCGALCMFIPGFGKGKQVRSRKQDEFETHVNVISRTVSLEKFECGSWASSAIVHDHDDEDGESMNQLYFDLPLELISLGNVNDAHSPVNSAFVFDKDRKGVLKNGSRRISTGRKSHESARHVRFSVSSSNASPAASCITPRLVKAREDFNAYLEAQSTA